MEIPAWCNDARFVLFVIAVIYIIYLQYKYVGPIESSCKEYKETIRDMALKDMYPVITNKVRAAIDTYVKDNKGCLNDSSIEKIRRDIKDIAVDTTSKKLSDEFSFDTLPKETC